MIHRGGIIYDENFSHIPTSNKNTKRGYINLNLNKPSSFIETVIYWKVGIVPILRFRDVYKSNKQV